MSTTRATTIARTHSYVLNMSGKYRELSSFSSATSRGRSHLYLSYARQSLILTSFPTYGKFGILLSSDWDHDFLYLLNDIWCHEHSRTYEQLHFSSFPTPSISTKKLKQNRNYFQSSLSFSNQPSKWIPKPKTSQLSPAPSTH